MSQNVAAVKSAFDALARGGVDRFVEHWADDLDHRAVAPILCSCRIRHQEDDGGR